MEIKKIKPLSGSDMKEGEYWFKNPHDTRYFVMSNGFSLEQAIADERESLKGLRAGSDLVLDTTNLSPHDLKRQIISMAGSEAPELQPTVEVQSFSYLQGVPPTASLVFDVRFMPNPYFENDLRDLAGDDEPVVRRTDARQHTARV